MSPENSLEKVKKLREITGVGFKDCNIAIDENNGDIEKSIEYLRKKGIAKANKRMQRVAAEGLVCIFDDGNNFSMIEINSETDFVAKNQEFIKFGEEISRIALIKKGIMDDILVSEMENKKKVNDSLINLITKIGEKLTLRRSTFVSGDKLLNFSYVHSALKQNVGKLGVLLSLETTKQKKDILNFGKQLAMHIAASSPLAIDKEDINQDILKKEKEIFAEELKNSGKDNKIIDKIVLGKVNKFLADNTLLNQDWIMDPQKKVKDVIKEVSEKDTIKVKNFIRYKVGEGV